MSYMNSETMVALSSFQHGAKLGINFDDATLGGMIGEAVVHLPADDAGALTAAWDGYRAATDDKGAQKVLSAAIRQATSGVLADPAAVEARLATLRAGGRAIDSTTLARLIALRNPGKHLYVKEAPVYGWRITGDVENIPAAIRAHLGIVDAVKYAEEYLKGEVGSVITVQRDGNKADFYPQRLANFRRKYVEVPLAEVLEKNPSLKAKLSKIPGIAEVLESGAAELIGMLRIDPATMYQLSEVIGPYAGTVQVEVPAWGKGSTQEASVAAFLVFEALELGADWKPVTYHHYVVNVNPIGYIPKAEADKRKAAQG